ncbi:hypothetical protein Cantr_05703, partial [Candida viswanathii]
MLDHDTTANEVLSNFFKRKGDKPLNEIEYEGVMALISKSRSGTPIRKRVISESVLGEPQKKKLKSDGVADLLHDTSNISFNTSEYKPNYLTIHNDTFDRSHHNQSYNNTTSMIPSIKRVTNSPACPHHTPPGSGHPNGDEQKGGFKFVNPYSRNGRRVLSRSKKAPSVNTTAETKPRKSISITANDIEKTISYNKSESLPEKPKDSSSAAKPLNKEEHVKANGTAPAPAPTPAPVAKPVAENNLTEPPAFGAAKAPTAPTFSFKPSSNGSLFSAKPPTQDTTNNP